MIISKLSRIRQEIRLLESARFEIVENVGDEIAVDRCQIYSVYSFR